MKLFNVDIRYCGTNSSTNDSYYFVQIIKGNRKGDTLWAKSLWEAIKFIWE